MKQLLFILFIGISQLYGQTVTTTGTVNLTRLNVSDTATAKTVGTSDSSSVVATTKWVKQQGYGGASGTYTPTFTNVTNLTSSTAEVTMYTRIGNIVTVTGLLSVTPTATGLIELRMSLPVASALTAPEQLQGPATNQDNLAGHVAGDETNDAAMFRWIATGTTARQFRFTYTYQVL